MCCVADASHAIAGGAVVVWCPCLLACSTCTRGHFRRKVEMGAPAGAPSASIVTYSPKHKPNPDKRGTSVKYAKSEVRVELDAVDARLDVRPPSLTASGVVTDVSIRL